MKRGRIEKRGKGYRITIRTGYDPITKKYKRHSEQFIGSYTNALKRLTQLLSDKDKNVLIQSRKMNVGQLLTQWINDVIKPNRASDTYESYNGIANKHIIPAIGHIPLVNLKKQDIQHLLATKSKAGLTRTVVLIRHITHEALKYAIPDYIVRNVASEVEVPKYQKREYKLLSESDIHILLEYARDTPYYELFYTYLFTGVRRSELLAIKWGDVDLDKSTMQVNRAMQYNRKVEGQDNITYKEPKTESSRRTIDLTPSNVAILKEMRDKLNAMREELEVPKLGADDLVFSRLDGMPHTPDGISHSWMKLVNKCGLSGVRLHDARHTHTTILIKRGVPVKVIQERLGHSKISTTLDIYTHILPGMQREAALKFDEALIPQK